MEHLNVVTWRVPRANAEALERVTLKGDDRDRVIRHVQDLAGTRELVYLPTCQRVLFAFTSERSRHELEKPLYTFFLEHADGALPAPEWFTGFDAFAHLTEVAASLDSLVPGEAQVLGQMKDAFLEAQESGRVGKGLEHGFQLVFRTAKRVRTRTELFRGKVSLIPLTLEHVDRALTGKESPTAVVVGTGTIGQKMIEFLRERDGLKLHVVSRSAERAEAVASSHGGEGLSLIEFKRHPPRADLVVLATPTESPFFEARHAKESRPGSGEVTVLDLSLPRNAVDAAGKVDGVTLVQLDDLVTISERSKAERAREVDRARALLRAELKSVEQAYASRHVNDEVVRLREDLMEAAEERWSRLPAGIADQAENVDFRKWYEQTVRHLVHVAQTQLRRDRCESEEQRDET